MQSLVENKATNIHNQADYEERYNKLSTKYSSSFLELKNIQNEIKDKNIRKIKIKQFLNALKSQEELLTEFSPNLFLSLVDRIEVYSKDEIKVVFKNE